MLYNHTTESVVTREQIIGALPSISRKASATDEQLIKYAKQHLDWDVSKVHPFETPAGMVAIPPMTVVELEGVAYKHYETITQEEYDAQQAAKVEADQAEQAAADALAYGGELSKVAALAGVFSILPGMDYTAIAAVMETEMEAVREAGNADLYMRMDMAKDVAKSAYERVLEPAGVTGGRLWRAVALLGAQA